MEIDLPSCLERWRKGDEQAAEEIIRHLYPVICRIVRTHLSRRDHEDDLIQDILMKTFSRLHQYKAEVPLSHWVSRLAVTTCLDRLRAHKIRPEVRTADLTASELELFDLASRENHTPDAGRAIEARDLVDKLLGGLPPADRSLILMTDLEGRSLEEISSITGWGVPKSRCGSFVSGGGLEKPCRTWRRKMKTRWENLLIMSAAAFEPPAEPPFGLATAVLARLREEELSLALAERIGLRAIFASMGALVLVFIFAITAHHGQQNDFEPGLRSLVQVENVPLS